MFGVYIITMEGVKLMSRSKISYAQKIKAVETYNKKEGSLRAIAKEYGVHHSCVEKWVMRYRMAGPEGLVDTSINRHYSNNLKEEAVEEYLAGGRSLRDICIKYNISTISLLQRWLKKYQQAS